MIEVGPGKPIWAMGLMSGTSGDGIDAAMVLTDGETIDDFGLTEFRAYPPEETKYLREVLHSRIVGGMQGEMEAGMATVELDRAHAVAVASLTAMSAYRRAYHGPASFPSVVGYHGQTVLHRPDEGWTVQLGDGDVLSRVVNRPVVWDFRSADMDAGGEGAPLVPFFHHAIARKISTDGPVAFLNIGGVANVTWVDPAIPTVLDEGALVAFDTGPGNALINDFMDVRTGQALDLNGDAASKGDVEWEAATSNSGRAYLERRPPKSLDRNEFAPVLSQVSELSTNDGAATLTAFTAECVAASVQHMPSPPTRWLVCGGGRHNATMMRMLGERLDAPVDPVEAVGLDGDMLEAQAFAYLAVRVLRGLPTSAPSTTGCREPVCGGRISYP